MSLSITDLQTPFDPTAYTSITGAQLQQLVSGAFPNTGHGMVLVTTDAPDTTPAVPDARNSGTPKWQNYIWLRLSSTYVTAYIWNPSTSPNATYLNWVSITSASFAPNSIPGYALITGSVPASALGVIPYSQISNTPAFATLNGALTALATDGILTSSLFSNASFVFGDLQGSGSSPGTPVIKPLAVTQGKIALQAVAGNATLATGQLKDRSVSGVQLVTANSLLGLYDVTNALSNSGIYPQTLNAVDPFNTISVPAKSIPGSNYALAIGSWVNVAAGDVLVVNNAKTGYVTNNRTILNVPDPTVAPTVPQSLILPVTGTVYAVSQIQGANTIGGTDTPYGRVLQKLSSSVTTTVAIAVATADSAVLPYNTANLKAVTSVTVTPLQATAESHFIDIAGAISFNNAGNVFGWIYLYAATGAATPIAAMKIATFNANTYTFPFTLKFKAANTGITPVTYYVLYGGSVAAQVCKNGETCTMNVEEYL